MRKLVFLVVVAVTLTNSLNGQIQMNNYGYVSIGNISPATSTYELTTKDIRISGYAKVEGGAIFESWYGGYPLSFGTGYAGFYYTYLSPTTDNKCTLGSNVKRYRVMYSYSFNTPSDMRQKENIRSINNGLKTVMALSGVRFDFKPKVYIDESRQSSPEEIRFAEAHRKNHLGFIAQDVYKILPEVVEYDDSADVYTMDYTKIIPVLVEAMKEQQVIIESLQSEIQELKKGSGSSKLKSAAITGTSTLQDNTNNALYQNAPNPFSQSTTIEYYLAENIQKAVICIYDMNGTQLKCIPLHLTGYGNITISGSELKAGIYMYSLIADGKVIDTKRMILTN
ncbi:MAG: tail fiber domain-containing protein [Bacteroidales bacterium]|nr:tail fiber domain-containing protein [Bacteroidales bacterium]